MSDYRSESDKDLRFYTTFFKKIFKNSKNMQSYYAKLFEIKIVTLNLV